ncbi:Shedu immune nuclease family protein [Dyadobacter sp. 3J3]|uniref:Shedu immune nuclease family protein n=1 Tax=Dyadobacter sp. 3J3 TaxID=2606600 RepID=UPI001E381E9A|nr:Shedu immune nuclease family protein [Dyadobacter sp. 3J3]
MIDADGNLDLIEIKKPLDDSILSKSRPRDNHVPNRELTETIMQVEKYIFHLNKWGINGEREVNEKYKKDLPNGLKINFTNPKGLLILGRSHQFNRDQKLDFEIIKRKYANIVDIITYDDLLQRLSNIIEKFDTKSIIK